MEMVLAADFVATGVTNSESLVPAAPVQKPEGREDHNRGWTSLSPDPVDAISWSEGEAREGLGIPFAVNFLPRSVRRTHE